MGEMEKGSIEVLPFPLRPKSVTFRSGRDSRARKERSDGIARFHRASHYFSIRMEQPKGKRSTKERE